MSKMYPKLPKGVSLDRDWRKKEARFYFRATGKPKVRLTEEPGTEAFDKEVACARLGVPYVRPGEQPKPERLNRDHAEGTLDWLVMKYKGRAGNTMAPDQLARRARLLERVCDSLTPKNKNRRGSLPIDKIERKHVMEIRDELARTAGAQDNLVKYMSAMFGWAMENDLVKVNPALRIKKVGSGAGFHTWTVDEVKQFEAKHPPGTKANLLLNMALFTGLRLQELAIMGRQHVREGWLTIRPGKTAKSSGSRYRSRSCRNCRSASTSSRPNR
ncbi:hypothetical protein [Neorhizobium sp. T7_12]|jgi:integrase|uniref:hypothetical protein n=1 Tax=Neorhizobium sp. T7_12 TaxID=2093832 RepID=UPI000CFA12FE|nr:hypothetical protein [Neorhizobium sp. T7_12]